MKKIKIYVGSNAQELKNKDFAYTIYLSIKAIEDNTNVKFSDTDLSYSIDNGVTWASLTNSGVTINADECVLFKGNLINRGTNGIGTFQVDKPYKLYGNPTSLINDYEDFLNHPNTELTSNYVFANLFAGTPVVNAHYLLLNSEELTEGCYQNMFSGCTSLVTAPELPATTLAKSCYTNMFQYCSSLTTAPKILPATTLISFCYSHMFEFCTSLTTAPELPAMVLTKSCYESMFGGCTSLTVAPELPATTLAEDCYASMFMYCTSLTTAPELPATTLTENCYNGMFRDCTSLTTAPELPATTLAVDCYKNMFSGCTNLNYIKALFLTTPGRDLTTGWVSNVSATGTFVRSENATWNVRGVNGIPNGWDVEPPIVPAQ